MKEWFRRDEIPDDLLSYFEEGRPDPTPCLVLDPFAGSGTVGAVALAHGRHAVLIELQESYLPLIQARLAAVQTRMEGVE